jgi:hypothetical protein
MSSKETAVAKVDKATKALSGTVIGKALLDGGLSLVPGLGAAISSALNTRASHLYERNSRRFAEQLKSEMERLNEEKLDKEFIESNEFVSLLTDTLTRNAKIHEQGKTRLFARAFANFSSKRYSSIPHKEGFLEIIERLSLAHASAMAFIYRRACEPVAEGETIRTVSAVQVAGELGIKQSHVEAWCEQLARYGLIKDARLGTFNYEPGVYEITGYGREFSEFLGDVAAQPGTAAGER